MKIGVISDTHSKKLPQTMLDDFKSVDFIIHVGDFCNLAAYESLASICEIKGVCGNMDEADIVHKFPKRQIIECGGFKIGMCHGGGPAKKILQKVRDIFRDEDVDVIVFGHSHYPFNETMDGVLYFNPGSPTDTVFAPYLSYGILHVSEDGVTGEIIKLDSVYG